jgi:hypothetical protein
MLDQEDEEVRRCRRVRQELFARFKTPEELHAWMVSLEKQAGPRRGYRTAKAHVHGKARAPARNGKPANGKPVHKA